MSFDISEILRILYGYRKIIIGITGIVAIGSIIISLLKPDYYKAETTFFPASQDLAMPEKIFGLTNTPMQYYGTDRETDRILAAARSNELYDAVIEKFNLIDHYGLDLDNPKSQRKARKEFSKHYMVQKNKLDGLELWVEDTDGVKAAEFANGTRDALNSIASGFLRRSQGEIIEGLKQDIDTKTRQLDTIITELSKKKKEYGIVDASQQAELLATRYLSAESGITKAKGKLIAFEKSKLSDRAKRDSTRKYQLILETNEEIIRLLTTDTAGLNIDKFNTGANVVSNMETYYADLRNQIARDKIRLQQVESAKNSGYPALLVIQEAQVPQRKHRPRRSILVAGSTIAAFLFSVLGVLLYYSLSKMDWSGLKE